MIVLHKSKTFLIRKKKCKNSVLGAYTIRWYTVPYTVLRQYIYKKVLINETNFTHLKGNANIKFDKIFGMMPYFEFNRVYQKSRPLFLLC